VITDQRGVSRPHGPAPDIGAYEAQPPPTITKVARHGFHFERTTLVVTFSHAMDAAAVESLFNYRLDWVGEAQGCRPPVVVRIHIQSAAYDPASFWVTLLPRRRLPLRDTLLAEALGQAARRAQGCLGTVPGRRAKRSSGQQRCGQSLLCTSSRESRGIHRFQCQETRS
jgi:hypothetical protein